MYVHEYMNFGTFTHKEPSQLTHPKIQGSIERAPVVFRAELEVAQHDGDLHTCDDEDQEHQGEEPKDVVELVQPNGRQNEEQLDEYSAEW